MRRFDVRSKGKRKEIIGISGPEVDPAPVPRLRVRPQELVNEGSLGGWLRDLHLFLEIFPDSLQRLLTS